MPSNEEQEIQPELDWLQLHRELAAGYASETLAEKIVRKTKENPFIPIGCLGTLAALTYGLWSLKQGRSKMSQYMMRTRIVAQAFTIMAFVIGLGLSAKKGK